jgi:7-carboxy-7-deazaguanine synthase
MTGARATLSEIFASYQGEGARVGEKHLFVRFAGCNLRCRYCDTPESLVRVPSCKISYPGGAEDCLDNPLSVATLSAIVSRCLAEDPSISKIALTGGEPMLQHAFITTWLKNSPPPVGCLLETAATVSTGLEELIPYLDTVSADIKLPSNSGEEGLWDLHREFLGKCKGALRLYIKMPVSDDTDAEDVRAGARLAHEAVPGASVYLQPITDSVDGTWKLGPSRMLEFTAVVAAESRKVMVLPQMHKLLAIR